MGKRIALSRNRAGRTGHPYVKTVSFGPYLTPHAQKINRYIKIDHRTKYDTPTIKLPKENLGENLCELELGKDFFFSLQFISFKSEVMSLSRVRLFATPWTVAYQASLSM